jgi:hypothetical protein
MIPYRKWRDGKGNRGNQNHQGTRSNDPEQTYTQNSNQAKGKGYGKGSKGKGKGKGKPRYGDRKKEFNERNDHEKGTKPVTSNLQKVYLGETHCLGDDETTIIFAQNATRTIINPYKEEKEEDDEATTSENNEANEYERLSLELAPIFEGMIKEMMALPDSHDAWAYMNPTMYHLGDQSSCDNLTEKEAQHVKDFQNWFDGTLFINHEFKERTKYNYLSSPQSDTTNQTATIKENTFNTEPQEEQGSSSIEEKPMNKINWGERKMEDVDKAVDLWLRTNIPKAEKKNGDTEDDSYLEEMTLCSICEQEMSKLDPGIHTCQRCLQWIKESTDLINKDNKEEDNFKQGNARTQGDDEIEFNRIPIAGENESDYEDSDEYEEEEDSTFPDLHGEDLEEANSTDTEDSEFQSVRSRSYSIIRTYRG